MRETETSRPLLYFMHARVNPDDTMVTGSGPGMSSRLLLAGGGHAHLGVLAAWISQPLLGVETTLVTPEPFSAYSGMIPGWMAGHYRAGQNLIDWRALARRAGIRLVIGTLCDIDPEQRLARLADGTSLPFDLLSLAVGGEVDTSSLAVLGERLLPVRPVNDFVAGWPDVLAQAALCPQYRLIVVGGGAAGVELALGARRGLRRLAPGASVTLVTDVAGLVPGHVAAVRARVRAALETAGIAVHIGHAAGTPEGLLLADGSTLLADRVIAATGSIPPLWLKAAGLLCDHRGFIAVGADLRSLSHAHVFAAGDIVARLDRPVDRSGVHAVKAGPVLAANLRAALSAGPPQAYVPRRRTLYLLATGDRRAILSWGGITLSGRAIWWLKDWIDRSFIARCARLGLASGQGG